MNLSPVMQETGTVQQDGVPFGEALRFWVKLGFISFGGPAGQISIMHQELVERKGWISERQYLRALNFCMLLPGPEAQQLATYMGWRLHGITGGIAAGGLFILPAIFIMLFLSWLAAAYGDIPLVAGMFYGIQAVVLAIVIDALIRIGKRAFTHPALALFAVGALIALQANLGFPLVIAAAAVGGLVLHHFRRDVFAHAQVDPADVSSSAEQQTLPSWQRNLTIICVFVLLWALPVGAIWLWRGGDDILVQLALFFTYVAFITFGGAYAVLAYIAEVAVNDMQWLTATDMIRGLGLAESTPGPLIMVTQYVGFFAGWNNAGSFSPLLYGTAGALITVFVTFLPSFLFIFLGAPYIEFLAHQERLQAALTGITAAVVGVIANLAIFFGQSVLLTSQAGIDWAELGLTALAFLLLRLTKIEIYWLVPFGAIVGMLWTLVMNRGL